MRTASLSFRNVLAAFALAGVFAAGLVVVAHGAGLTHGSVGPGHGVAVPGRDRNPCDGELYLNYDGSAENGYCWQYGGIAPPYYGAFAECYHDGTEVCGMRLLLTGIGYPCIPCDLYVWDDAGGVPGNVLSVTTGANPCPVATWPNVSTHDFAIAYTSVSGAYWVGYWADFSYQPCGYFVAADTNGAGGCPYTNIAPGIGYPTGWQNVATVWGSTQAIGIGAWAREYHDVYGACCFPDGSCIRIEYWRCTGEFMGTGTYCNPCVQPPTGACCGPEGACEVTTQSACGTGDWRLGGVCDPNFCPPDPIGACCVEGICSITTAGPCSGVWQGPDTYCDPNPCIEQPGGIGCAEYAAYAHLEGTLLTMNGAGDVAMSGSLACVASGGLLVVDLSNKHSPRVLASLPPPPYTSGVEGVAISGAFAYIVAGTGETGELQVVSLAFPSEPVVMGTVGFGLAVHAVAVSGQYAYVAAGGRFLVVDVSDPWNPETVGSAPTGNIRGVALQSGLAYVAGDLGLQVIDVSDPRAPSVVGQLETPVAALGVASSGDVALVADGDSGLLLADVSDPANPRLAGSMPCDAHDVAVSQGVAYVAAQYRGGLLLVDISNPVNPQQRGIVPTRDWPTSLALSGGYACVGIGALGIMVVDLGNSRTVPIAGVGVTPGNAHDIDVAGHYAYVADGGAGLQVFDVSNVQNPVIVGSAPTPGADAIALSGGYAYLITYVWQGGPLVAFHVIDVHDPRHPLARGQVGLAEYAYSVAVSGTWAYVANQGLVVIDAADPAHPTIAASLPLPDGYPRDVAVSGGFAYIADGHSGLQVIDISDPSNPTLAAGLPLPGLSTSVAVGNTHAYVTTTMGGLQVVDVMDPRNPRLEGVAPLTWDPDGLAVSGSHAFAMAGVYGSHVFDVRNPQDPKIEGSVETHDPVSPSGDLVASGAWVYLVNGVDLLILPVPCEPRASEVAEPVRPSWQGLTVFPNPARGETSIRLALPAGGRVSATIHDVAGRCVRELYSGFLAAGPHELAWDGRDVGGRRVPAGIYLARFTTSDGVRSARLVMVR